MRYSFHPVILLFSLLFAAQDYHAGFQKDVSALCETEVSWQESETESAEANLSVVLPGLPVNSLQSLPAETGIRIAVSGNGRSFTPFPACRLYLQYRQIRTDC